MILTRIFEEGQQAAVEVAHVEISRVLGSLAQRGGRLTEKQINRYFAVTNREHSAATLRGLLRLLKLHINHLNKQFEGLIEFAEITKTDVQLLDTEQRKTIRIMQLNDWLDICMQEIAFVRMCLMLRTEEEVWIATTDAALSDT
jgi:hypothetical protein